MKNRILLPALVLLMVLSSCSNSRYGRVPKVKAKKHTAVAQKQAEKKEIPSPGQIAPRQAAITQTVVNAPDIKTAVVTTTAAPAPAPTNAGSINAPETVQLPAAPQNIVKESHIKKLKKAEKLAAGKEVSKGSWLWYVIIGLILVIVGVLIPIVGIIFYIVGVIAIIYGLLLLLGIF